MRGTATRGKRIAKTGLVLTVVAVTLLLLISASALAAPPWSDAPNGWWVSTYGITESQAATVADGWPDGTFRPMLNVTRAQFAKMAGAGLGVPTAYPSNPTFSDVPTSHYFFPWIEGGAYAGLIAGQAGGTFGPDTTIIRQQANSILGNYLAQRELTLRGHIAGKTANYPSLNTWYVAEGMSILAQFADASRVASVHAPATAYLVYRGVVQGSHSSGWMYLGPNLDLTRGQAVALILRVKAVTFSTALPTVSGLNPTSGLPSGGNSVVITGTNFTEVFAVRFGTANATFTVNSTTQITAVAPAGTLGTTVDVTVETAAGISVKTSAGKYAYGLPTLTALSPASGPVAGGNTVVITGTSLSGATAVKFGTKPATSVNVVSSTQITAVAPSGTGTVDVTVTTPGGTTATSAASKYSYGAPTVTLLSPTTGPAVGGNSVVITGTGFTGVSAVKFGTKNATSFVVNSPTQITAIVPSSTGGTMVDVTVTTAAGTSAVSSATKYYYGGPVVTSLSPAVGPATGGNTVVIYGTGFTSVSAVMFGSKPALSFIVNSSTMITAMAPSGTTGSTVYVTVTTPSGTSSSNDASKYTYGTPVVTDLDPNVGSTLGGTEVTITGTGFAAGATVTFSPGYPATSVVVVNSTEITCVAPAHPAGVVDVVVTTLAGSSSPSGAANDFTYRLPATTPSDIYLTPGSILPVGAVVDVAIPAAGGTDITGKVLGWVANTACNIRFTVVDAGSAHSTITIRGSSYASGNNYKITSTATLTIVVTTTETGRAPAVRTFLVSVAGPVATAPSAIDLLAGATNPVGGVTDVSDPGPGGTDSTGAVLDWIANTDCNIRFTVTDAGAADSTIRINGASYTSGNDYKVTSTAPQTIVVTTTETGKATVSRTFIVSVTQVKASAPSAVDLLPGATNPVGSVVDVAIPAAGATDSTGKVLGWVDDTDCNIRFTVTDTAPAVSTIRIKGVSYTSGNDYKITSTATLNIVVTTTETGKATVTRTFLVTVTAAPPAPASAPSSITLAAGDINPVGGVVNVADPGPDASDSTGQITGWVTGTHDTIKFTVVDSGAAHSTITIQGLPYASGANVIIGAVSSITIVVTTTETGKATVTRTFIISVSP